MAGNLKLDSLLADDKAEEKIKDLSFEHGLELLEELVEQVESGELALDSSITAYERGVALLSHLRSLISGAEKKLEVLQKSTGKSKKASKKE